METSASFEARYAPSLYPIKWTLVPIECSARAALMRPTRKSTILGSPMVTQIKSIGMVLSWSRRVWVTFVMSSNSEYQIQRGS
jgi:hypothetical protein